MRTGRGPGDQGGGGPDLGRPLTWLLLGTLLLGLGVLRARLLDVPLERDEGEYAYSGQLLLQGVGPYAGVYTMKFPGTSLAYAGIMAVLGESARGIRLGLLGVCLATTALVFVLGRALGGAQLGLGAAAVAGLLAANPQVLGFAAHATHFVALPAMAGLAILVTARDPMSGPRAAVAGALLGLAVLARQSAVFLALVGALDVAGLIRGSRGPGPGRRLAAYATGLAVPILATVAVVARAGMLDRAWFWSVDYAREYVRIGSPVGWASELWTVAEGQVSTAPFLWLAVGVGVLIGAVQAVTGASAARRATARYTLVLLAGSVLAVIPGGYFRSHYLLQLLPAAGLLAGLGLDATGRRLARIPGLPWLPVLLLVAAGGDFLARNRGPLLLLSPEQVARDFYRGNAFPELEVVARFLREHTPPDARLAVLGSEPQVYFLAGRRGVTGYVYMYGLTEPQRYAGRMRAELIREVEGADPDHVVFVAVGLSWLARRDVPEFFDWVGDYCRRRLALIGLVDALPEVGTRYRLGGDLAGAMPASAGFVAVLARRSPGLPPPPICAHLRPPGARPGA